MNKNIHNPMEQYFRTMKTGKGKDELTTCHEGTEGE
jgi:hypothetical protein